MSGIYDVIGGEAALEVAVDRFYERAIADPMLAPFFGGMNLRSLKLHQVAFLSQALGGPARYTGAGMRRAHSHMRIEQRHFDRVAELLSATLQELAVPEPVIESILERLAPLAPEIVNTPPIVVAAGAD